MNGIEDRVGELVAVPIRSWGGAEMMRQIRNTCRAGFAHNTAKIGRDAQRAWWRDNRHRLIGYLYIAPDEKPCAYGLLRREDDGRWWSSVAVLPAYGGQGYGGAVTAHLIRQCPTGEVWAEARKDQPAAMALHHASDWEVVSEDADRWQYRTLPNIETRLPRYMDERV